MIALIEECKKEGNTLGGIFEVVALGLPPGSGQSTPNGTASSTAGLAQALMSIQAMKGVEVGLGFEMARRRGSQVHDEIFFDPNKMVSEGTPRIVPTGFYRGSNNSGGTEGGMTNGAPLVVRVAMKPISTLMSPLQSVDLRSKQPTDASVERSDVCAAPAAAVVGESRRCLRNCQSISGEIRRRLFARNQAQLRKLSRTNQELLTLVERADAKHRPDRFYGGRQERRRAKPCAKVAAAVSSISMRSSKRPKARKCGKFSLKRARLIFAHLEKQKLAEVLDRRAGR